MSSPEPTFWNGKRVFLTGHTGFKGRWLDLWLQELGAVVHGFALDAPTVPNLFELTRGEHDARSTLGDIRDYRALAAALTAARPEIVLHLAAQPLVRASYEDPLGTYATNVMGTANVLEAARHVGTVKAVVVVTTDKVYENREWAWGYREDDTLGGHDPYSSSKGAAEIVAASYRRSFLEKEGIALASARAGNVVGGGDWAIDRLVPDVLRAFEEDRRVTLRNPTSIRPWQHVLEPLSGYLILAERLFHGIDGMSEAWNFGPSDADAKPVGWIVDQLAQLWGGGGVDTDDHTHPHEAHYLKLDISKAAMRLGWRPTWSIGEALEHVVDWHRAWLRHEDVRRLCIDQIHEFSKAQKERSGNDC